MRGPSLSSLKISIVRWALRLLHNFLPRIMKFYELKGIKLYVPKGVFNPTFTFSSSLVIEKAKVSGIVADFGCGSGALSVAFALRPEVFFVAAYDISPIAVATTKVNSKINGVEIKVRVFHKKKDFLRVQPFDVFVSNPPYLPIDPIDDLDRSWCGGKGLEVIYEATKLASKSLKPGGRLYITASSLSNLNKVIKIIKGMGFKIMAMHCTRTPIDEIYLIEAKKFF